jgi:hypothetical protein
MPKKEIRIGKPGELATTHCFVTGKPLGNAPINYHLKGGFYVSVNQGQSLSVDKLKKILPLPKPVKKKVSNDDNRS